MHIAHEIKTTTDHKFTVGRKHKTFYKNIKQKMLPHTFRVHILYTHIISNSFMVNFTYFFIYFCYFLLFLWLTGLMSAHNFYFIGKKGAFIYLFDCIYINSRECLEFYLNLFLVNNCLVWKFIVFFFYDAHKFYFLNYFIILFMQIDFNAFMIKVIYKQLLLI